MNNLIALFLTIIVELSIFKIFYSSTIKEDLIVIFVNGITNISLSLVLMILMLLKPNNSNIILYGIIIMEVLIFLGETIFYKKVFNWKNIILYSLMSNAVTLLIGLFAYL
jgi:hypothetical protein